MNPRNKKDFKRLVDAVKESRHQLEPFRKKRTELISLFVGSEYNAGPEIKKTHLNLMALATNIYVRQCAARAPIAKVVTPHTELRPMASSFSLACKEVASETNLGVTLRRAVTEALYSPCATVKIGLHKTGSMVIAGSEVDITEPFVSLISFDDYVRDMSARSAYEPSFEGNTYYLTLDELHELYPETKDNVSKDNLDIHDEAGGDRAEGISHSSGYGDDDFAQKVAVQDVYLTKEKQLVTYLLNAPKDRPLDVIDWDGTSKGPYFSLWFTDVPDNAMPLPPFSLLKNIHNTANSLLRRITSQAEKQKRVVGFSDADSAKKFNLTRDGDGVAWTGQPPQNIQTGGIDQPNLALFLQVKDMFSWASGNLDSLGGLSPMAETAKQDEMLTQSASAQLADMQEATTEFAAVIFREIAWYEWTDPVRSRLLQKSIPGTDMSIAIPWAPETRQGQFIDFNFSIIPQSMQDDSPARKIGKLNQTMMQMIMPLMPVFEQQGFTVDARKWVSLIADYSNLPELEKILVTQEQAADGQSFTGDPNPGIKPMQTKRTYERFNRSGATRVGKEHALMQTLLGGGVQPSEQEALNRGIG